MKDDLALISGNFFDCDIPKNKRYMIPYFNKTECQMQFLRYYIIFKGVVRFTSHTGFYLSRRWWKKLRKRYHGLERVWAEAQKQALEGEFEMLEKIQKGKYSHKLLLQNGKL